LVDTGRLGKRAPLAERLNADLFGVISAQ